MLINNNCILTNKIISRNLYLRPDEVTDGNIRDEILRNASVTEEEYFVAPPGNVVLEKELKNFD